MKSELFAMASTSNICFGCNKSLSEGETVKVKDGLNNLRRVSEIRKDGNLEMLKEVDTIEMQQLRVQQPPLSSHQRHSRLYATHYERKQH